MPSFFKRPKRQMSDSFTTAVFIILSGGFQDAYTYICRGEVFANAQTGNIVLMSGNLFRGEFRHCIRYLIPVISFIVGIYIAECVHARFKDYEKIHWRQIIILFEIVLLFSVGFMPQKIDTFANALVSFVCAMQVQTFHKVRGHAYASTMCIGNMRCGTEALFAYFRYKDKRILHKSMVYFGVIFVFAIGAGIGGIVTRLLGVRAIWVSCALLCVSFLIMFFRQDMKKVEKTVEKDVEKIEEVIKEHRK